MYVYVIYMYIIHIHVYIQCIYVYVCIYFISNFVCHVQKCQPMYKKQDVFLNKLYFVFFLNL